MSDQKHIDRDFNFESQPGLPAPLPAGEDLLWQGRPDAATLSRDAFKLHWITGYLIVIALWRAGAAFADGGMALSIARLLPYLALAGAGYLVIRFLGWMQARATVYSITSARVIMRIGAALPITYTIPFVCIDNASVLVDPKTGHGTIALQTSGNMRLSYGVLWPHVRPWLLRQPQPAFRAIPDAGRVARLLADAAQAKLNEPRIEARAHAALVAAE
jgi:hypothetical protein